MLLCSTPESSRLIFLFAIPKPLSLSPNTLFPLLRIHTTISFSIYLYRSHCLSFLPFFYHFLLGNQTLRSEEEKDLNFSFLIVLSQMGSLPPELSLDFRPTFVPKTISAFLKELSMIGNCSEKVTKLDDFVRRLEEEMRKIDAFKRELPLCMLLLNDAILALKEETLHFMSSKAEPEPKPVLEEFIPMKKESDNEGSKKERDRRDKKRWMSTFQLYDYDTPKHNEIKRTEEDSNTAKEVDTFQIPTYKKGAGGGRAFMPYSDFPVAVVRKEEIEELPVPSLSLLTPGIKNPREESGSSGSKTSFSRAVSSSAVNVSSIRSGPQQSQTARKQRRCWSPELHRRFVNALQQLGGSQSATPKQIRELMQVDGLTNDEVKSHLQKYRLHTRRAPGATATTPANQSVVVLGGLWMPQDHCSESSKTNSSQSGSPQGPFQLGAPGSTTGGDSMDDEEDEAKSESYSWKSHGHTPIKSDV